MDWKIPLFRIYHDQDDVKAVESVLERGSYWAEGPEIRAFESALEKYFSAKHALAFSSGTAALHAALLALDLKGGEVIVPSFTFISTANAVVLANARPVFAEVESETLGLDAEDVEKRITKKTAAILPVHFAGMPARDTARLKELAEKKGLLLVEDAAESLGAKLNGKMAGTFGNAGMLSFCQNKVVSTGEGGAILTDDSRLIERMRLFRSHGRLEGNQDYFSSSEQEDYGLIGYNYRIPSMLAGLGISQLAKADRLIGMRRAKAGYYHKRLSGIGGITVPEELKGSFNVYQMYTVLLDDASKRSKLQAHLAKKGIMSKVYFGPVHLKKVYRETFGCRKGDLPKTEEISSRVLALPFYPHMPEQEIDFVADSIKSFFREA